MPTLTIKSEELKNHYIELETLNNYYRVRVCCLCGGQYNVMKEYTHADKKKALATYNRYKRSI